MTSTQPEVPSNADYDLSTPVHARFGLKQGLTSYGDAHFSLFIRKVFIKALGYGEDALSRPIVGIINTFSGFNPCHGNAPQLIEAAKRGVHLAGGLAIEFPTISVAELFSSPTSMFLRNLMSMDTEEMIAAQPIDACIVIGGCDKTVPAQIMGGISANKPVLPLITGPMMPGSHQGTRIGACTDCRNNWAAFRAGKIDVEEISSINEQLAPTIGTCGVMGTASTMACLTAALGLIPLKGATAPAVSAARLRIAEETGRNAVHAATHKPEFTPQSLLTRESFLNAITVLQAIGGSTNAIVHLMAIINRHPDLQGQITLADFDTIGRSTPLIVDLKPSGDNYMTDFHNAGGMLALLHTLRPLLHLSAKTISGQTLGEILDISPFTSFPYSSEIIRPLSSPLSPSSALVVLKGNLAPNGAVMKAAASKVRSLLQHTGPAVVFSNTVDLALRIDDPNLAVKPDSVLVLQNIGPVGNPGMPEAGLIPIPRKLASQGVVDMLRISDGRMSGTAGGTIVLHVSPEAAIEGSVLGVVRDGDLVSCDVERRELRLEVSQSEIESRLEEKRLEVLEKGKVVSGDKTEKVVNGKADNDINGEVADRATKSISRDEHVLVARKTRRGYRGLYERSVNQAHEGADFDFLTASGPSF